MLLLSVSFVGCDRSDPLVCYVPDGAPVLAVANIVGNGKVGNCAVSVLATVGEDVISKCASGEADLDRKSVV